MILNGAQLRTIDERAWTFQENQLSPTRALNFRPSALLDMLTSETALVSVDVPDISPGPHVKQHSMIHRIFHGSYDIGYTSREGMSIVNQYATRRLTDTHDKLETISGVIKKWRTCCRDSYAAELWHSYLLLGLFGRMKGVWADGATLWLNRRGT